MSEKHLIRFTEKSTALHGDLSATSMNLDEKIKEYFKDLEILSYEIETMNQSSVLVPDGRIIVSTSLILNIILQEPTDDNIHEA